jgi:hypothetical protein
MLRSKAAQPEQKLVGMSANPISMDATMSREEIAAFLATIKKLRGGLVVVQFECCASMKLAR